MNEAKLAKCPECGATVGITVICGDNYHYFGWCDTCGCYTSGTDELKNENLVWQMPTILPPVPDTGKNFVCVRSGNLCTSYEVRRHRIEETYFKFIRY